jgi:hypothetical protein
MSAGVPILESDEIVPELVARSIDDGRLNIVQVTRQVYFTPLHERNSIMQTELEARQRAAVITLCTVSHAEDAIAPVIRELENVCFSKAHIAEILEQYARDLRDGLNVIM